MNFVAKNYPDLKQLLSVSPTPVTNRGRGRTTSQTEGWVSRQLLPTLALVGFVHFPVKVECKDRPDLRMYMPEDSAGIELTEVVPEIYAQADAIRNQYYPNATVDRSIFTWGAKFSTKQIHNHLSKVGRKLTGPGWTGNAVEQEWADAVNKAIIKKLKKFNDEGFTVFPKNWLAAYTSSPGPTIDINRAAFLLVKPGPKQNRYVFDIIFILTDKKIVVLDDTSREIHDLVKI